MSTVTSLCPLLKSKYFDNNGAPLFGGTLSTFQAGTSTPIVTYLDSTGTTPNTNPIQLNSRGECDCWLLPNVAYKFQLKDSLGNIIWTEDSVVNGQLITLYGGVDTGIANQYALNFTASFSSYVQGTVIYWIPANSNTGASTINVNGLGVVAITNADTSALTANEIIANQWATIIFTGSGFQLINLNPNTVNQTGSFTVTVTGVTGTVTGTVTYARTGRIIVLSIPTLGGTSNATSFGITGIPSGLQLSPGAPSFVQNGLGITDSGTTTWGIGNAFLSASSAAMTFEKSGSSNGWTASGQKTMGGFIMTYFVASNFS